MNAHRIRVGIGVGLLGVVMSVGVASAQTLEGSSNSGGGSSCCSRRTTTTTVKKNADVLPQSETSVPPSEEAPTLAFTDEAPASAPASTGTLPFTGGDVAGMVLLGGGALAIGTVLVRRSKTQPEA